MPVGTRGAIKYLSAADYEAAGRRDRARQHLPPDAAPGRRDRRRASVAWAGSPAGGASRSPTRAASRCSRSSRKVDDDGVTFRSVYDGSTHRFTPESAVGDAGAARRRHPDGARRVPAAAVAGRRGAHWPSSGRPRGRRRPAPPTAADDQAPVRHRAGRRSTRPCAPSTPSARAELDFDGYGIGGLSASGRPAHRCCRRSPRGASRTCPPTGRAT